MDELLNELQTARILKVSVQLLRKLRAAGGGPEYIKVGRCVRYTLSGIESYINSHKRNEKASNNGIEV
jgi:hypothetical protein